MVKKNTYQKKRVLVLGLAKSGYHAAKLLFELGADVTVNDAKDLNEDTAALELIEMGIPVISGGHPANLLDESFDVIVKNPGIPYSNPVLEQAAGLDIPIITEVEVATSVMEATVIGVTGSNGKTTTTSIIHDMLNQERENGQALAIGNIGVPASQVALDVSVEDDVVMELSSFQLMGTPSLKPKIAVITNLFAAHLDYHGSVEDYHQAKMNLIANQEASDVVIFNKDQVHLEELVKRSTKAHLHPFSRKEFLENGTSVKEEVIYFNGEAVANVSDIFITGDHNLENMLAAISVAKMKGFSNEAIQSVLRHFHGVKHRTQFVTEFNERIFYNDSKATNIEATENALSGFSNPVILLAGGLNRGDTFERLIPLFKEHVKALIVSGETADLLMETGKEAGIQTIKKVENVAEAVPVAYAISSPGDTILLSPAAASWDQYPSFEVRGDRYIEAVNQLINSKKK